MKTLRLSTLLGCIGLLASCGGNFREATYDGPVPMTLINSDRFLSNYAGNTVYLNPDDGSLEFGGTEFRVADFFSCGLAYVVEATDDPRWGYIDRNNQFVLEYKYRDWEDLSGFSEGLAIGRNYNYEYVVFNTKGERIATLSRQEWTPQTLYKDGYSVWERRDMALGLLDTQGNMRVFEKYHPVSYPECYPSHGLICVYEELSFNTLFGAMDIESGELVIPCKYAEPFIFDRNGYAAVKDPESGKYGLIDLKGEYTIPAIYTAIETDGPNLYRCCYRSKEWGYSYGWYDHKGENVIMGNIKSDEEIYFFSGRPEFVKIDYDPEGRAVGYILFHRNRISGEDFSGKVSGEDYREFLSYPVALRNGNSIGFYRASGRDQRCLLVDDDFERVGTHEFHVNASFMRMPKEMKRLRLFYTHGIPYVNHDVLGNNI